MDIQTQEDFNKFVMELLNKLATVADLQQKKIEKLEETVDVLVGASAEPPGGE